ncbi:hypothetical protein [Acidisphaera sp. L21]|uniref:hypothetical protein n=1 Tax=Acidisphaera sp. L21 TaxID=1641851 RepID=UPI00131DF231|nr:hypothetical protein [Acidisphaera sp. L21]
MSTIINSVDAVLLQVPFMGILRTGIDTDSPSDMAVLQVRVTTDGGLVGWGEAFGHGCCRATKEAIESLVGQALIGADASDIAGLSLRLQRRFHLFGRTGPVRCALAGIDIALWDLAGKMAGLPLYRLLGGRARESVPAYASLERYGARDTLVAACERAVAEGYRAIKLHEIDVGLIRAAREVVGPDYLLMPTPIARGPLRRRATRPWHSPSAVCAGWRSRSGRRRTMPASPRCATPA